MIEINKQGNAIRIDFTDNDKYLFNGTMEVAPNELMLVVDESDMITFKRTTNGDVLFSQAVNNIKIAGSAVTKDNVIEKFATIGYQSGTSNWDDIQGKPLFAGVATSGDYNDLINKPTIPDISNLATKLEIADMETKSNAAATYATKAELGDINTILDSINGEVI